jgi:excisionase family DNA binding protein
MSEITAAPDRLLTIREAAEWLNVSPITVRRRIAAGELEAVRIGNLPSPKPKTTTQARFTSRCAH